MTKSRTFAGNWTIVAAAWVVCTGCSDPSCDELLTCGEGGAASATGTTTSSSTSTGGTTTNTTTSTQSGGGDGGGPTSSTASQGGSGASGDGGSGGSGSGGDGGGGTGPGCELRDGAAIGGQCGIFVDAGALRDGDGTQASPRTTIAGAIAQAEDGDVVFVCASTTDASEAVTLSKSVTLVGGLGCATWTYEADGRTAWTAAADAIPLRVTGAATDVRVEGFAITSADASTAGASSIGVLVHEATVAIERSTVEAGSGAAGSSPGQAAPAATAEAGDGPVDQACTGSAGIIGGGGGDGDQNACQGSDRAGGRGVAELRMRMATTEVPVSRRQEEAARPARGRPLPWHAPSAAPAVSGRQVRPASAPPVMASSRHPVSHPLRAHLAFRQARPERAAAVAAAPISAPPAAVAPAPPVAAAGPAAAAGR